MPVGGSVPTSPADVVTPVTFVTGP